MNFRLRLLGQGTPANRMSCYAFTLSPYWRRYPNMSMDDMARTLYHCMHYGCSYARLQFVLVYGYGSTGHLHAHGYLYVDSSKDQFRVNRLRGYLYKRLGKKGTSKYIVFNVTKNPDDKWEDYLQKNYDETDYKYRIGGIFPSDAEHKDGILAYW